MLLRLSAVILASAAYGAGAREDLSTLKLENATITSAQVVAAGKIDRTRPLCAYPKVAKYAGSGSIDGAQNFVCK